MKSVKCTVYSCLSTSYLRHRASRTQRHKLRLSKPEGPGAGTQKCKTFEKKINIYNPINQREIRLWHRKDSYVNQVMTPYDNVISGLTAGIKVSVDITREDLAVVMNTNSKSVPTRNICGGTTCVFNLVQIANTYQ